MASSAWLKLQPSSRQFWCFTMSYKVEPPSAQVTGFSVINLSLTQPPNSVMTRSWCCQILPLPNLSSSLMMAYPFPRFHLVWLTGWSKCWTLSSSVVLRYAKLKPVHA
ncbi:uncharacterized protein LOC109814010 isoform X2 [Cajanus cajan]|uniref:uncharacterized protein LOC109814010 isoform X2 n=1 Tax=Cajanus cajan TaxID=3821 RepID=UPI0010FAD876|nr:uncharacterized protein LOC109814010 isoform X2 [Cajanus cajan]